MSRTTGPFTRISTIIAAAFGALVIFPLLSIILLSISARMELVPTTFTLRWHLFNADYVFESVKISLLIAIPAIVLALLISLPLSYALVREKFRGKAVLDQIIVLPMIIPQTVLGLLLLQLFKTAGLREIPTLIVLILSHTLIIIPFMARPLMAALQRVDRSLEEAAFTLGAKQFRTFWGIVWPAITPGVLAGTILSLGRSFNDFIMTMYLIDPRHIPMSIRVYLSNEIGIPQITAASSVVMLVISVAIVFIAERFIEVDVQVAA